jgi:ABC-type dipeptide/oligopeptide/nickel transport system permease subunit
MENMELRVTQPGLLIEFLTKCILALTQAICVFAIIAITENASILIIFFWALVLITTVMRQKRGEVKAI